MAEVGGRRENSCGFCLGVSGLEELEERQEGEEGGGVREQETF